MFWHSRADVDCGLRRRYWVEAAAFFEGPYSLVVARVKPERDQMRRQAETRAMVDYGESAPNLRAAISGLRRYIVTPRSAKHRIFTWVDRNTGRRTIDRLCALGRWFLRRSSLAQSTKIWALRMGTQWRTGRVTRRRSCSRRFPLPSACGRGGGCGCRRLACFQSDWQAACLCNDQEGQKTAGGTLHTNGRQDACPT